MQPTRAAVLSGVEDSSVCRGAHSGVGAQPTKGGIEWSSREDPAVDISGKVATSLSEEPARLYAAHYLDLLTANWRELQTTLRRTLGLLALSAGAFELIRSAQLQEATVAGLKISNFSNIQKLLPVVVAYLAFQLVVHHTTTLYYQRIHTGFHQTLHPKLREERLHVALRPVANLWWEPSTLAYASGVQGRLARNLGNAWSLATVFGVVAFEVYAYVRLLDAFGANWLVLTSVGLTVLLLARTLAELRLETGLD
jgi:hypothetical protein